MRGISSIRRTFPGTWQESIRRQASSSAYRYVPHEGHGNVNEYEEVRVLSTNYNRHHTRLMRHQDSKALTVVKSARLAETYLQNLAMENSMESNSYEAELAAVLSYVDTSPQALRWQAEKEAYAQSYVNYLAPGICPGEAFVLTNGNTEKPEFYVAWPFMEDYVSLDQLPKSKDGKRFIVGNEGETRLIIRTEPTVESIDISKFTAAIYDRQLAKYILNLVGNSDPNIRENGGVRLPKAVLEGKEDPIGRYRMALIDFGEAFDYPPTLYDIVSNAKRIAQGLFNDFSGATDLDLNHLNLTNRLEVRQKSFLMLHEKHCDRPALLEIFCRKVSRDYEPKHRQKISKAITDHEAATAAYLMANALTEKGWNGGKEDTDIEGEKILSERYGANFMNLKGSEIWRIEDQKQGIKSAAVKHH